MRKTLASVLIALAPPVHASTSTSDYTDLWWNPSESGWGVNAIQQGGTLFLTFFVYGADGSAHWYSASDVPFSSNSNGVLTFQGALFETRGILYGGATQSRQVGSVVITFTNLNSATMTYTVDGNLVSKQLQRYTFRTNNLSGSFLGLLNGTYSNCGAGLGYSEEVAPLNITQASDGSITISSSGQTACEFRGTYSQAGRLGSLTGSVACTATTGSATGTFHFFDFEPAISGLAGRGTMDLGGGCTWSGRVGWVKRNATS